MVKPGIDSFLEGVEGLSANYRAAVNRKERCAPNPDGRAYTGHLLDQAGVLARIQALVERCCIQAERGGELFQVILAKRAPVFSILAIEQQVMIFPVLVLVTSAFGCFGGPL